ncbi:MAG TPA: STAS domain-containing protein [Verrucomicrobiae bacterium]|jgi:anti-anti-sigma factor|nr:STAS domain-containing protein [Verrucomicrobiae bacterium]
MKFIVHGDTLNVSEIKELGTATANSFRSELSAALPAGVKHIDLDLSQTTFVDCGGLGALVAIRKRASNGDGTATIRLVNPPKPLQHIVTMMKMGDVFPIDPGKQTVTPPLNGSHN